jgi:hypothetical protein
VPPPDRPGPFCGAYLSNRDSNLRTSPRVPSSTNARTVRKSESQRRFWYGLSVTPRETASATERRAAAGSMLNGLSQTTDRPSPIASSVRAEWVSAGVEMLTASAPAAARAASESNTSTPGCSTITRSRRSADVVTTPRSSHSGAAASSGAWKYLPPKPYPTSPILTGST